MQLIYLWYSVKKKSDSEAERILTKVDFGDESTKVSFITLN